MNKDLTFDVTENGLARDHDIKYLLATNGVYDITVFYYGDYEADRKRGELDLGSTLVSCRTKGYNLDIKYMAGMIYLSIIDGELMTVKNIDRLKSVLDVAQGSALALVDLLREYGFKAEI